MTPLEKDPWVDVKTVNGLPADEVISTLQKSIRRGMTDNALLVASEMSATSAKLENFLWQRLMVISIEDVGMGDPSLPVLIETLGRARQNLAYGTGDRFLFCAHAVRLLCAARKDRTSDEMTNWARQQTQNGTTPEIPDFAIDMHTNRGQSLGRTFEHFLREGAKVENEIENRDQTYRNRLLSEIAGG